MNTVNVNRVREIKRPLATLKNEYYAMSSELDSKITNDRVLVGPCVSLPELEKILPQGKWVVFTRVREVEVL